uniref:Ig-like domain-containing protein n=1 Tax=Callorhinchus milii TaxID=7868 RepID=A0A4W3GKS3_CALMI
MFYNLISYEQLSTSADVELRVEVEKKLVCFRNIPNPIEYTDTVTLTCDVKGTVESRLWFKDERALHSNDRITISQDNATLTIISVTRNDGGTYRCEASILYGPDTPELTITGTHSAELGDSLTLSCSAQSNPEAQYKWIFNGTVLSHTTPQLTIDQISPTDRGSYTWSPVDQSATIAAITLGVILFVIIILLIAVVVYRQCGHSAGDPGNYITFICGDVHCVIHNNHMIILACGLV